VRVNQIGYVVRDLDAAVRAYADRLGIGGWLLYTYGAPMLKDMTYRGRPQPYRMRLALTQCGDMQLELIQSLEGPNIYEEFLERHGEGIHHLGVLVPDLAEGVRAMERQGYQVIQSGGRHGKRGDGGFAYFETEPLFATTLELIQRPVERVPPEATYPPDGR
jgi:catechol 2,3-dioxygenase-like lactoylglutathione lyase family enzyme